MKKPKGWTQVEKHFKGLEDSFNDAVCETAEDILGKAECDFMWDKDNIRIRFFFDEPYTREFEPRSFDFLKVLRKHLLFDKKYDPNEFHSLERVAMLRKISEKFTKMADAMEKHHQTQKL